MKRLLLLAFFLSLAPLAVNAQTCDKTLMSHVYHPTRLAVKKGCITVTGVIKSEASEPDGDIHMRLLLDPGQGTGLINNKNKTGQHGFLVFEPLCQHPPTQADAKAACKNFKQNLIIPPKNTHVSITGMHMLDKDHGWLEIHPVTSITVIP